MSSAVPIDTTQEQLNQMAATIAQLAAKVEAGSRGSTMHRLETLFLSSNTWWHAVAGAVAMALGIAMPHSIVPTQVSDVLVGIGGAVVGIDAIGRHAVTAAKVQSSAKVQSGG